jgi:hypothetical protein
MIFACVARRGSDADELGEEFDDRVKIRISVVLDGVPRQISRLWFVSTSPFKSSVARILS